MDNRYDIVALGELLIDFTPGGLSQQQMPLYECNPGGAPANVLAAAAKQGSRCAFIGKVGSDQFGRLLSNTLTENHIDTTGLCFDPVVRTTLAFVSLDETGNRSFSFFRSPGADIMLRADEVPTSLLTHSSIFHFGSLSLTDEPARSATVHAISVAKKAGALISYDPNLRPPLWPSLAVAKEQILAQLCHADVVKISEEEFEFLTGAKDYEAHAAAFAAQYDIACLLITLGPGGVFCQCPTFTLRRPTYDVKVVDTTGAGDAFFGTFLGRLSKYPNPLAALTRASLNDLLDCANAAGALASSKKGGIPALATAQEIEQCRKTTALLPH